MAPPLCSNRVVHVGARELRVCLPTDRCRHLGASPSLGTRNDGRVAAPLISTRVQVKCRMVVSCLVMSLLLLPCASHSLTAVHSRISADDNSRESVVDTRPRVDMRPPFHRTKKSELQCLWTRPPPPTSVAACWSCGRSRLRPIQPHRCTTSTCYNITPSACFCCCCCPYRQQRPSSC